MVAHRRRYADVQASRAKRGDGGRRGAAADGVGEDDGGGRSGRRECGGERWGRGALDGRGLVARVSPHLIFVEKKGDADERFCCLDLSVPHTPWTTRHGPSKLHEKVKENAVNLTVVNPCGVKPHCINQIGWLQFVRARGPSGWPGSPGTFKGVMSRRSIASSSMDPHSRTTVPANIKV